MLYFLDLEFLKNIVEVLALLLDVFGNVVFVEKDFKTSRENSQRLLKTANEVIFILNEYFRVEIPALYQTEHNVTEIRHLLSLNQNQNDILHVKQVEVNVARVRFV